MTTRENLPVYPPNVKGDLRIILQLKDLFVIAYKYLEDYRDIFEEYTNLFTKDFLEEQMYIIELDIEALQNETEKNKKLLDLRGGQNIELINLIMNYGLSEAFFASPRRMAMIKMSPSHKNISRKGDPLLKDSLNTNELRMHLNDIDDVKKNKVTLIDYYRELYYLQLNYNLVLARICSGIMPIMTEQLGLIERLFFWSERPEMESLRQPYEISDRLNTIYCRTQRVVAQLGDTSGYALVNIKKVKNLQVLFRDYLTSYNSLKDMFLRRLHDLRQELENLEEENDRLVGTIVKIDPGFVKTDDFFRLGENWLHKNRNKIEFGSDNKSNVSTSKTKSSKKNNSNMNFDTAFNEPTFLNTKNKQNKDMEADSINYKNHQLNIETPKYYTMPRQFTGELLAEFSTAESTPTGQIGENSNNHVKDSKQNSHKTNVSVDKHVKRYTRSAPIIQDSKESCETRCPPSEQAWDTYSTGVIPSNSRKNNKRHSVKSERRFMQSVSGKTDKPIQRILPGEIESRLLGEKVNNYAPLVNNRLKRYLEAYYKPATPEQQIHGIQLTSPPESGNRLPLIHRLSNQNFPSLTIDNQNNQNSRDSVTGSKIMSMSDRLNISVLYQNDRRHMLLKDSLNAVMNEKK